MFDGRAESNPDRLRKFAALASRRGTARGEQAPSKIRAFTIRAFTIRVFTSEYASGGGCVRG